MEVEVLAKSVVDCGFKLHRDIGPGLLESVYEILLFESLKERGISATRQALIPVKYKGRVVDNAFRADLIIEGRLLIELKSIEAFAPVHGKQVLTYLRLMGLPLGLLMNFGAATFKEGVRRIANDYYRQGS
jgi:GxxExxY protein